MEIRGLNLGDYDKVYELWIDTEGMGMRSVDDSSLGIEKFIKRNPYTSYVAQIGDEIVGVILCGHDGRRGYIYHTAVRKGYRGKGIGKALVEAVVKALKEEEITKVSLVAFKANDLGNKFWNACGFEIRDDLIYRSLSISDNNFWLHKE